MTILIISFLKKTYTEKKCMKMFFYFLKFYAFSIAKKDDLRYNKNNNTC